MKFSEKKQELRKKDFSIGYPPENVEKLKEKDWEKLMENLNDYKNKDFSSVILFITFLILLSIVYFLPVEVLFVLLLISIISYLHITIREQKIQKEVSFLNRIIEEELRKKEKIIPDWFIIKNGERKGIKFRKSPKYSDGRWKKMVENCKYYFIYKIFIVVWLLFILIEMVMSMKIGPYNCLFCEIFSLFTLIVAFGLIYTSIKSSDLDILFLIKEYEEDSGEKVIPEKYREKVRKCIERYKKA